MQSSSTRILAALAFALTAAAQSSTPVSADSPDLSLMSMRDLMNLDVTSVSRKSQKLSGSPAAIYVITAEDIRRSGATSIPEVLRLAPGLDVARIDSEKWAISSRGFNGRWANKLLVLIDGRTVYSPVFAGVFWDVQDTILEDIDRIEIIRGPGAAVWGANAVNGVINIITKTAAETQGGLVSASGGSEDRAGAQLRYGGEVKSNLHYRVYGKYFDRRPQGAERPWRAERGGFRADWDASPKDLFTFQGGIYSGREDTDLLTVLPQPPFQSVTGMTDRPSGGNLLARWKHFGADGQKTDFQVYIDRTRRADGFSSETANTVDLDVLHQFRRFSRHKIVAGAEARFVDASLSMPTVPRIRQDPFGDALTSGFVQDEIVLAEDRLSLVVGSKLEHTGYSGTEFVPAAQLSWTPASDHAVWLSAARSVRTPSLVDRAAFFAVSAAPGPGGLPMFVAVVGNPALTPEKVSGFEAGYRVRANDWLSIDWTGFYNIYSDLRTSEPGVPFLDTAALPPHFVLPLTASSLMDARSYGMEVAATLQPHSRWRLNTAYSWQRIHPRPATASRDPEAELIEKNTPRHQVQLRSYLDLPGKTAFDAMLSYVGALQPHEIGLARPGIPAYARLDLRFGWQPARSLELSFCGQDLTDRGHWEFIENWGTAGGPVETGRRVYGKITVRF